MPWPLVFSNGDQPKLLHTLNLGATLLVCWVFCCDEDFMSQTLINLVFSRWARLARISTSTLPKLQHGVHHVWRKKNQHPIICGAERGGEVGADLSLIASTKTSTSSSSIWPNMSEDSGWTSLFYVNNPSRHVCGCAKEGKMRHDPYPLLTCWRWWL